MTETDVSNMDLQKTIIEFNGIERFNPMQEKALKAGFLQGNAVIASPTASGKTLLAEFASLNSIINNRRKVIYTCPLRALASEHYREFKRKYSSKLGIRAALSIGDFDSSSQHLANYDIIFGTYEKLDSLLRHRADWLGSIGLLVIDEVHSLGTGRGPVLEMSVAKLRMLNPHMQVLALSATISNAEEIAEWLNAELVKSDFRPVELHEGVFFGNTIIFKKTTRKIPGEAEPIELLAGDTLRLGKQMLAFANTRKRSESIAKALASLVASSLSSSERALLKKAADRALNVLESPTEQCRLLASLIEQGVSFHHAGLLNKQREIIEEEFRKNRIKAISATPTLAMGVNLPSFRVVLASLYRYSAYGQHRIPVLEYKQMAGRAGRPSYDTEGEAIMVAHSEIEADELFDAYINGKLESISSALGMEAVLRTHLLAAIATNFVFDLQSMEQFFSKTFYATQYRNLKDLFLKISSLLTELEEMGFITSNSKRISATQLGARVSELYLDPLSAHSIIKALKQNKHSELFYLYTLTNTTEFSPYMPVQKSREAELWEGMEEASHELPIDLEREQFYDINLTRKFNTALMLRDWVNEVPEQALMHDYKTQPGTLHAKLEISDWLAYALLEISKLLNIEAHTAPLSKLRKRLKHGVREELLMLTELRGIGRVRARKLWNANIRTISGLKKTSLADLGRILGAKVAAQIARHLIRQRQEASKVIQQAPSL